MSDSYLNQRTSKDWKKSSKHGAGEWLAERFTSVILIPLVLWAAINAYSLAGKGYDAALAFIKSPLNAALAGVLFVIVAWHQFMGLKAVIDDYVGKPGARGFLNLLNLLFCLAVLAVALGGIFLAIKA